MKSLSLLIVFLGAVITFAVVIFVIRNTPPQAASTSIPETKPVISTPLPTPIPSYSPTPSTRLLAKPSPTPKAVISPSLSPSPLSPSTTPQPPTSTPIPTSQPPSPTPTPTSSSTPTASTSSSVARNSQLLPGQQFTIQATFTALPAVGQPGCNTNSQVQLGLSFLGTQFDVISADYHGHPWSPQFVGEPKGYLAYVPCGSSATLSLIFKVKDYPETPTTPYVTSYIAEYGTPNSISVDKYLFSW